MLGIRYDNDGDSIEIVPDVNLYHFSHNPQFKLEHTIFVQFQNSFGYNFYKMHNAEKLCKVIEEYQINNGVAKHIVLLFNEIVVEPAGIDEFEKMVKIPCVYATYDMQPSDDPRKLFLPLSLYTQVDYLINEDFMNGKKFLQNMNFQYEELRKPHKLIYYSNHISPTRIDIFNILKATDNLKGNIWSFAVNIQHYSADKHNISSFLKDNEGLIPHSYDKYSDKTINLKHTYFSQFLAYFEIVTESYFFKDIKNIQNHCPITEKIVRPIASCLPFIFFGAGNTKKCLELIGMTFNSPLYGFYDAADENDIQRGLSHVTLQSIKNIDELHEIYFNYVNEYKNNCDIFFDYFVNHKKLILDIFNGDKVNEWKEQKFI